MIKLAHKFLIAILISCFMVGCATQQNKDPLEGVNRVVYKFNDVLDKAALKPVAQGYQATTVGLLGFFDVHSKTGGVRTREDFGQTLGYYGVGSGAYLVLPFFGPSSTRDGIGFFTDAFFFNPIGYINDDPARWALIGLAVIDIRAEYMDDIDIRDKAFDPYAFMRDSYMQNRENLVKDGAEDPNTTAPYTVPLGS